MAELTEQGRRVVNELVQRHGFSPDATQHMVIAVLNGNGQMAQFNHPEFAGGGQWMRGGMIMIGDMFNNYLKGRIDALCSDVSNILQTQGGLSVSGSFQSQSQSGSGDQSQTSGGFQSNSSLFAPDPNRNWWPESLGVPNATGSQNQTQYAYFANSRRLAVKTGSSIWVYDTLDHSIGGFSQQQGSGGSITFSSQYGTVNLSSLPVVMRDGQTVTQAPAAPTPPVNHSSYTASPQEQTFTPNEKPANQTTNGSNATSSGYETSAQGSSSPIDIIGAIEKLGDLKSKGILTDEEFAEKKKELLSRL